jgi:hypothetical protein
MSQQLAGDEDEADAEDYELEHGGNTHQRLATGEEEDEDDDGEGRQGGRKMGEENVVFAMGDDSDEEGEREGEGKKGGYRDMDVER